MYVQGQRICALSPVAVVTKLAKPSAPPNMRLKLSGLLLRESAVASPGAPLRGGPVRCARAHAARSLSAIR